LAQIRAQSYQPIKTEKLMFETEVVKNNFWEHYPKNKIWLPKAKHLHGDFYYIGERNKGSKFSGFYRKKILA
jgi:hypothetical protein